MVYSQDFDNVNVWLYSKAQLHKCMHNAYYGGGGGGGGGGITTARKRMRE